MRGPLRWFELHEKVDWADSALELSVTESQESLLCTELGDVIGLGTVLGTVLGEPPGLGTALGTALGDVVRLGTVLGTELGESSGLGDTDWGKQYRRLRFLCSITSFFCRSRNRRRRSCLR